MKNNRNKNKKNKKPRNKIKQPSDLQNYDIMPATIVRNLRWIDPMMNRTAAAQYISWRYLLNGIYRPDAPASGTSTYTGLSELAAMYEYHRSLHCQVEAEFTNLETFPIGVGMFASNVDVQSAITSATIAKNYLENGLTTGFHIVSGNAGMNRKRFSFAVNLRRLIGNPKMFDIDDAFEGNVTANPLSLIYIFVIVVAGTATNLTNGVTTAMTLRNRVRFYQRVPLQA